MPLSKLWPLVRRPDSLAQAMGARVRDIAGEMEIGTYVQPVHDVSQWIPTPQRPTFTVEAISPTVPARRSVVEVAPQGGDVELVQFVSRNTASLRYAVVLDATTIQANSTNLTGSRVGGSRTIVRVGDRAGAPLTNEQSIVIANTESPVLPLIPAGFMLLIFAAADAASVTVNFLGVENNGQAVRVDE